MVSNMVKAGSEVSANTAPNTTDRATAKVIVRATVEFLVIAISIVLKLWPED